MKIKFTHIYHHQVTSFYTCILLENGKEGQGISLEKKKKKKKNRHSISLFHYSRKL
jgi:hypothetical protein